MDRVPGESDSGWNAVAIDRRDNVAVALAELIGSANVLSEGREQFEISLLGSIPIGHKFATRAISAGTAIIKYGQAIGIATLDIPIGAHVHVHNVVSDRARSQR